MNKLEFYDDVFEEYSDSYVACSENDYSEDTKTLSKKAFKKAIAKVFPNVEIGNLDELFFENADEINLCNGERLMTKRYFFKVLGEIEKFV